MKRRRRMRRRFSRHYCERELVSFLRLSRVYFSGLLLVDLCNVVPNAAMHSIVDTERYSFVKNFTDAQCTRARGRILVRVTEGEKEREKDLTPESTLQKNSKVERDSEIAE